MVGDHTPLTRRLSLVPPQLHALCSLDSSPLLLSGHYLPCQHIHISLPYFLCASQKQPWKNPPTRAEVRIVEELYSIGEGAPAIRQQVLGARLGLDVADQLEEMGIFDASTMTQQDARELTNAATEEADLNGTQNATVANTTKGLKVS